jgi:pyrophosphate--fructose-6-phosphate 1-phosphotransferase
MAGDPSPLEAARASYEPRVPPILRESAGRLEFVEGEATTAVADAEEIGRRFPHTYGRPVLSLREGRGATSGEAVRVGVVLSGGQAPGGHNVIAGLHDALQAARPGSKLLGFLGGPRGILAGRYRELTAEVLRPFRNTGGFDLIGSGRDKIETDEQLAACRASCERLALRGLVIVGGDDSNTNAAVLAEFFTARGVDVAVVGVPKTIDGDLKGGRIEASFGFDTATKVYAGLIGNICRDALSAAKYWHFVKLMGRSASHVTLECVLRTHANVALIGEEVRDRRLTLEQVVDQVATVVRGRAEAGRHYGVCLVPEGLIEFVPEMRRLIDALNRLLTDRADEFGTCRSHTDRQTFVRDRLSPDDVHVFASLPDAIRAQLLQDRDAHGNVQVSKIDTEQLLIRKVTERVEDWSAAGRFPGKFSVQGHFFGYEGRCAAPSNFDADYTYSLGRLAAALAANGRTGYMCCVGNLTAPAEEWTAAGVPLTSLMQVETRKGRRAPVIGKALVRLDGAPFRAFAAGRERWALEDDYRYPGAVQYFGPPAVCATVTRTLQLERETAGGSS